MVAGVYSSVTQVNYNLLAFGAAQLINDGVWAQDFVGEWPCWHNITSCNNYFKNLTVYRSVIKHLFFLICICYSV